MHSIGDIYKRTMRPIHYDSSEQDGKVNIVRLALFRNILITSLVAVIKRERQNYDN